MQDPIKILTYTNDNCDCNGLSKRLDELRDDTERYKTQINITGGIFIIGVIIIIVVVIYFHISIRKMEKKFEKRIKQIDPLSGRIVVSGEPKPTLPPTPIPDRFKHTSGNFDGMSPTDFTHFEFPANGRSRITNNPGNNSPREPRTPMSPVTPKVGRW